MIPKECPSIARGERVRSKGTNEMPAWRAKEMSIRLSSAPESMRAPTDSVSWPQDRVAGKRRLELFMGWGEVALLASIAPTGELDLLGGSDRLE